MEGNPIIAVIMIVTMLCFTIWYVFAVGLIVAIVLCCFGQWLAGIIIAIPCAWVVGMKILDWREEKKP